MGADSTILSYHLTIMVRIYALSLLLALASCSETKGTGASSALDTATSATDLQVDLSTTVDTTSPFDAFDTNLPTDAQPVDIQPDATPKEDIQTDANSDTHTEDTNPKDTNPNVDDIAIEDSSPEDAIEDGIDDMTAPDLPPLDTGVDTTPPPPKKLWLLSIDNVKKMLQVVDIQTGEATDLCKLNAVDSYPSLTFSRLNGLYGSRGGYTLDRINPCTCDILSIGGYGGPTGVFGITADPGDSLFGVATTQDIAISIEVVFGMATTLGPLGVNFTTSGATYSQDDKKIYAINGNDDSLYTINMKTGAATKIADLNYNFGSVGIEVHPSNNKLYACSSSADLLEVDPTTGNVTVIGSMGQSGGCTNLAAPWFDVPCIALP